MTWWPPSRPAHSHPGRRPAGARRAGDPAAPTAGLPGDRPGAGRRRPGGEIDAAQPDVVVWDLGWTPEDAWNGWASWPSLPAGAGARAGRRTSTAAASHAWRAARPWPFQRDADAGSCWLRFTAWPRPDCARAPPCRRSAPVAQPETTGERPVEALTPRENEVLQLLAEGLTNQAIAQRLAISEHTVKFHVNAILGKLAAQSRADAVVRATRLG